MTNEMALYLSIGAGVIAVLYGIISTQWIIKQPTGNARMQEIQSAIQEGANAYMNRQYMTIGAVGVVLFFVLGFALKWPTAIGFAIGAILSALAGYIGGETALATSMVVACEGEAEAEMRAHRE